MKRDNKGMSLVEIVIAIAILSIAIIPLLYAFSYAAKYNAKARLTQRAATVAQTVMEQLKAYGLSWRDKTDDESFLRGDLAGTYWLLNQNCGDTDSSTYDVLVEISPVDFVYNLVTADVFDASKDAVFESGDSGVTDEAVVFDGLGIDGPFLQDVIQYFCEYAEENESEEEILSYIEISREMDLKLSDHSAVVQYCYTGTLCFNSLRNVRRGASDIVVRTVDVSYLCAPIEIFHSEDSGEILRNVYYFYYPFFSETGTTDRYQKRGIVNGTDTNAADACNYTVGVICQGGDKLTVSNSVSPKTEKALSLFIFQQDVDYADPTAKYDYQLTIYGGSMEDERIDLYHNLDSVTGSNATWNHCVIDPYSGSDNITIKKEKNADGSDGAVMLLETGDAYLLYSVKVSVYSSSASGEHDTGSETPLIELSGTIVDLEEKGTADGIF